MFDDIERTENGPGSYMESSFSFLNRAADPYWDRIRNELDSWYQKFPDATKDLWRRFRSDQPEQHYGAWWELYLHRVFINLGYDVTPNTSLPEGRSHPDLRVERSGDFFYVEATIVFSGIEDSPSRPRTRLEPEILDVINTIDSSNFFVTINFVRSSTVMPRRSKITDPIATWLAQHDPDEVAAMPVERRPEKRIEAGEWVIDLRLLPRAAEFRGRSDNRLVGTHGGAGGYLNDRDKIVNALARKKKQHKTPDGPMVIAVMPLNGFVEDRDFVGALYGSEALRIDVATGSTTFVRNPDGFYVGKRGPANKKVSAVLAGVSVLPNNCARTGLRIWHHFLPDHELTTELPFATAHVTDDQLVFADAAKAPNQILGLPEDWPGLDPRLKR